MDARCIFVFFMIFNSILGISGIALLVSEIFLILNIFNFNTNKNSNKCSLQFIDYYWSLYYSHFDSWSLFVEKTKGINTFNYSPTNNDYFD